MTTQTCYEIVVDNDNTTMTTWASTVNFGGFFMASEEQLKSTQVC